MPMQKRAWPANNQAAPLLTISVTSPKWSPSAPVRATDAAVKVDRTVRRQPLSGQIFTGHTTVLIPGDAKAA